MPGVGRSMYRVGRMTPMAQSSIRNLIACLILLSCSAAGRPRPAAQDSGVLSERPQVIRIFDPDKNETTTSAFLFDLRSSEFQAGFDSYRPLPGVRLHSAEYSYPGRAAARPRVMAFVFVPRDKYKTAPNFSVTADGAELHQGEATLREMCCVEVNGRSANPQHIVVAVPMEIFGRLRQAKKIELKLSSKSGKYSFKLNGYQRKCLDALANTIK